MSKMDNPAIRPSADCFSLADGPFATDPTLWLFIGSATGIIIGILGYCFGWFPAAITVLLNSLGLYFGFTVLHDGVHGAYRKDSRIALLLPHIWGFLLTFSYPFFQGVHIQHHRHTNVQGRDPDYVLSSLSRVSALLLGGPWIFCSYRYHFFSRRLWRKPAQLFEVLACDSFYIGILAYAIYTGWVWDLFLLWILPLILTLYLLVYTFDYLPHHPHDSTEKRLCARAYGGKCLTLWMCAQNYHLVHHLWPSIPWYKYPRAFRQVYTDLKQLGCRVDLPDYDKTTPHP